MSTGPKSSDNLQLLKELMLGDEQREIAALREQVANLEAGSVERLSRDLAGAMELRNRMGDQSFDELVAALQAGTESAIQRSVREDKSRLSKALFPIMGPAIRSYVVELFRSMAEDLNETVKNTTSLERVKWRLEAKSSGIPFSEYVMIKTAHYTVEEVFLMQRESGLLLQHAAADPEDEDDDVDMVSGMFTAIRSFVRDSFGDHDDEQPEELKRFTIGERQILIEDGPSMVLAAVVRGNPPPPVRDELKTILEGLQHRFQDAVDHFSGDMAELTEIRPELQKALMHSQPAGAKSGGMWRAWLLLTVLILGLGSWIGYRFWEQRHWNRFETALQAEPGIEVIDVQKRGGARMVVGLRDPLAREPSVIAGEHEIKPEKVAYQLTEVPLPVPAFIEQRKSAEETTWNERHSAVLAEVGGNITATQKEIETTRQQIEASSEKLSTAMDELLGSANADLSKRLTDLENKHRESVVDLLRSQYGHLEEVQFELTENGLKVEGSAPMPDFAQLATQLGRIQSLGTVDISGLKNATEARVEQLLADIAATGILYQSGSQAETDRQTISTMVRLAGDLIIESGKLDQLYRFDVVAHPLIGELREGNRPIEMKRAEQIRQQLIEEGIPAVFLTAKLSEDLTQAGNGVSLVPALVPAR